MTRVRRATISWRFLAWFVAFGALVLLVVDRFDLTTIHRRITLPDGGTTVLPNGWYTVDHPFHVTRAQTLIDAIRDGELLRWFGQHQGGYPAEFYPTGAAWLDAAIWAVTLGQLPTEVIHKVLIAAIVLAPTCFYLWWARRDSISPGVALLAGAGHIVIAGEWWSGGWTEIALWGLVTNVAAQTAILGSLAGGVGWLRRGNLRDLGFAALFAGLALGINPRTALGLVAVGIASIIVAMLRPSPVRISPILRRGFVLAGLSFAVAAPVLIPLIRYRDLYYFVHYSEYADVAAWWASSKQALWEPIFWLAMLGIGTGIARSDRLVTRTVAITAVIYMSATAAMITIDAGVFEQLELTRLMPFQRMLLFYLAALALYDLLEGAINLLQRVRGRSDSSRSASRARPIMGVALGLCSFFLVFNVVIQTADWVPEDQVGLRPIGTSAQAPTWDLEQAVRLGDELAMPGTAILVLGTVLSWHQGLTAPMWSDRRFFYDDWLWYWQRDHVGPYNPNTEHAYPVDAATLTPEYLATHGIGAVIVTDVGGQENRAIAAASPLLSGVHQGYWFDVLLVNDPISIVSAGDNPAATISIDDQAISATGDNAGEAIVVRHNWHPRWVAELNGVRVDIAKRADGYMEIATAPGAYALEMRYEVTAVDWFSRILFVAGLACVIALLSGLRRLPLIRVKSNPPNRNEADVA